MASGLCSFSKPVCSSCTIVSVEEDGVMNKSLVSWTRFIVPIVESSLDSIVTSASSGVRAMYGFVILILLHFVEMIWLIIFPPGISIL